MALEEYRKKRNFKVTSEPGPVVRESNVRAKAAALAKLEPGQVVSTFVIQKHAASHLHYDFRLEMDGVLKSWAVPKGPSLDPSQKRLAMEVEDHPVDYAKFEGEIPSGEYGAGDVIVWDEGIWASVGDARKGLKKGHLEFDLQGEKLRGRWNLVRTRKNSSGKNQWLLMKRNDAAAKSESEYDVTLREPGSVLTGRLVTPGRTGKEHDDPTLVGKGRLKLAAKKGASKSAAMAAVKADATKKSAPNTATKKSAPKTATKRASTSKPAKTAPTKATRAGKKSGAAARTTRGFQEPPLALLQADPPSGDDWIHEVKFDGYRTLAQIEGGRVRLFTRSGLDWTAKYGDLPAALAKLDVSSAWLDGEIAVVDEEGRTQFHALQAALKNPKAGQLLFYAFDLLEVDGEDLRDRPLEERKTRLHALLDALDAPIVIYSDHWTGNGQTLLDKSCEHGLEGIISKRRDSPYASGRGGAWVKAKCGHEQEFVICGYSLSDKGSGLRSLLLGVYKGDGKKRELRYVGRVGTGFDASDVRDLLARFRKLARKSSPFPEGTEFPTGYRRGPPGEVVWLEPKLVAQVAFRGWTAEEVLRQASFKGLREDKPAESVGEEKARGLSEMSRAQERNSASVKATSVKATSVKATSVKATVSKATAVKATAKRSPSKSARESSPKNDAELKSKLQRRFREPSEPTGTSTPVKISHPDRVIIPDVKLTKQDLIDFYRAIERYMLPHVANRPLSLLRCPDGIRGQCFFQKNLRMFHPPQIETEDVENPKGNTDHLMYLDTIEGIVALAQFGAVEIHVWGAHRRDPLHPDLMVFDLDPGPGVTWKAVVEATYSVRETLRDLGLESFVKVSGGKGFHIHVPIEPRYTWEQVKEFSKTVAQHLEKEHPDRFVSTVSKAKRNGRIFIDYLRNGYGATSVAPYSLRARAGGLIALPISWEDVAKVRADEFTIAKSLARLKKQKKDPWADYFKLKQRLEIYE